MRKIIITLALILMPTIACAKVSKKEAFEIYYKLVANNYFFIFPNLEISDENIFQAIVYQKEDQFRPTIRLYKGLLDVVNKDELALVLGHEIGHSKMWYYSRIYSNNHINEFAADWLGFEYMKRAGFDQCKGREIFKKFSPGVSFSHPDPKDRYNNLPGCQ